MPRWRWVLVCALAVATAASGPGAAAADAGAGAAATWLPVGRPLVDLGEELVKNQGSHSLGDGHKDGKDGEEDDDPGVHDHDPSSEPSHGLIVDLHDHTSIVLGGVIGSIFVMMALVIGHLLHHFHITWLPESAVLVALGGFLGLAYREIFGIHYLQEYFGPVNVIVLNVLLLPPIILESGWSLRRQDFLSQLEYILVFALLGTVLSTMVITTLLVHTGFVEQWHVAFTFASLISAVDPVATLATYSSLQVEPLLNIMVFGESVINDAVAIVLFKAGNDMAFGDVVSVPKLTADMLTLLMGSPLVGLLVGAGLTATITSLQMEESRGLCGLLICISAWFTYGMAELLGVSGIIATLFCSIVLGAFLRPKLPPPMRDHIGVLLSHQACVADMAVFMFVGVFVMLLGSERNFGFSLSVAVFCLIGRAVAIFPLGWMVNMVKRCRGRRKGIRPENLHTLSGPHLVMMWHGGLRGGIAMALCLEINHEMVTAEQKENLQEATFFVICTFLLFFGGTTQGMLRYLQIPMGVDMPEDHLCKDRYSTRGASLVYTTAQQVGIPQAGQHRLQLPRPTRANKTTVELQGMGGLPQLSEEGEEEARAESRASTGNEPAASSDAL